MLKWKSVNLHIDPEHLAKLLLIFFNFFLGRYNLVYLTVINQIVFSIVVHNKKASFLTSLMKHENHIAQCVYHLNQKVKCIYLNSDIWIKKQTFIGTGIWFPRHNLVPITSWLTNWFQRPMFTVKVASKRCFTS